MASILDSLETVIIQESLTNRIRAILDEYPDGTQIARELLQNSDDACSKVQWYLLDHRDHVKHARTLNPTNDTQSLQLIHKDFHKYMGPALLAGNDSVFEEKDFVSLRNLASSEKHTDESKIGQMGIGFNSIYHLTDCPSFITGDQFMVIDPHLNMFKNNASGVCGPLSVLSDAPDQLRAFSVLEEIDCAQPYQGTIFRFPLRTEEQEPDSKLSDYAYTPAKVLEMLRKLKDEALRALLFLKHVEKITIYERKEGQDEVSKLFEIEVVNAEEVRKERLSLINNLKAHVNPDPYAYQEDVLQYSVRPTYRITQEDGSTTVETWNITTLVGNVVKSREYMKARTDGNLSSHRLIPWVGIAAPMDLNIKIDAPGLFCFLPMGIQLPFPVHINGHFAVKHSRREIWTNQDNDFSSQAAANIKSLWNVHLFEKLVPEAYAMFLENVGLDHGANYDLWPTSGGEGIGLDGIWKDLLKGVVRSVLSQDRKVFLCGSKAKNTFSLRKYSKLYFAERDIDRFPLLKEALHSLVNLAEDIPNVILRQIASLIPALDLGQAILTPAHVRNILFENKEQWGSTADSATRMEMLKYCLLDNNIADLEGLPLLPLDGDIWVDFAQSKAHERFLVPRAVFDTLSRANGGLVNLNINGYPFDQIMAVYNSARFWMSMPASSIAKRIRQDFRRMCYQSADIPAGCVAQSPGSFPSNEWIKMFWAMAHELPDRLQLLWELGGVHLLPVGRNQLAPLSTEHHVIHLKENSIDNATVCRILEQYLDCNIIRSWLKPTKYLKRFFVDISDAPGILDLLSTTSIEQFSRVSQQDRELLATYVAKYLQPKAKITENQRRVLRSLPIYKRYSTSELGPLDTSETSTPTSTSKHPKIARGYTQSEHPWLPQSIDLFADDQPMREHLRVMLSVSVLPESEYWYILISNPDERSESDWDAIMTKLAPSYHIHSKIFDLAPILRKIPFVLTKTAAETQSESSDLSKTSRLSPESVVHPSLAPYFHCKDSVFPAGIYCQAPLFGLLYELGMSSTFDAAFVQGRLQRLFGSSSLRMKEDRKLVESLYGRLNSEFSERFLSPELRSVFTAVKWVYTGPESEWCTPENCRPQRDRALVGDKMPLAEFAFTNDVLLDCIGWKSTPPLKMVLENLFSIIDKQPNQNSADSTSSCQPVHQERNHVSIDSIDIRPIYQYLSNKIKDPVVLKDVKGRLRDKPWVLVSGTFYTVNRVALKMQYDLHPHLVQLPTSNLNDFYLELGVRETVRQEDMEEFISTVASKYPDGGSLTQVDVDLVYRLLTAIADGQNPTCSVDLLLLTDDGGLKRAADVVYDDVNIRQRDLGADDLPYTFAHRRISYEMAERLSIVMFSERCLQDKDNSFIPFSQQENIIDRIKGILIDYDAPSIFNEFLQNASDAGATECRFWLDLMQHPRERVLNKPMEAWQGPALMIYNNVKFSEEDFNALCKLGVGNKKEDTSKIGRHGLGFNSVYHFTDMPSIVSGDYIGFLDPHMTNLPKSRDYMGAPIATGGLRCNFRKLSMETFEDQLSPYKGPHGCDMRSHFEGTLFRIPLRMKGSGSAAPGSGFGDDGWTVGRIQEMMVRWVEDAKVGLLFLKNIKSIRICDGHTPEVTVTKTYMDALERPQTSDTHISNPKTPHTPDSIVKVEVSFKASESSEKPARSDWLICCDSDFPSETFRKDKQLAARRHWSPHRGVAFLLQQSDRSGFQSHLFVHLPTLISTGLPFHIHGDFALTSNRKSLAGGNEGDNDQRTWNSFLIEKCLPGTTIRAMEHLATMCYPHSSSRTRNRTRFTLTSEDYFKQFPIGATMDFKPFLKAFLRQTHSSPVFPCQIQPKSGSDAVFHGTDIIPLDLKSKVIPWLMEQSKPICIVPGPVISVIDAEWKESKLSYAQVDGDFIRWLLSQTPDFIKNNMKTSAEREWILGLAYKPVLHPKVQVTVPSDSLQILPLLNGEWKQPAGNRKYYVATKHERDLLIAKDILVDEDIFSTKDLVLVLDALIEGYMYNVGRLPVDVFASTFLKENPGALTDKQVEQLWDYLEEGHNTLDAFLDFPILKTTYGTVETLKMAKAGLLIPGPPSQMARKLFVFKDLLLDLGIVVFESAAHRNHQYFEKECEEISDHRLLEAIATHPDRPSTRPEFTREEAAGLRELVLACGATIDQKLMLTVGDLPIWTTQGSVDSSPLIAASGAFYLERYFDLNGLGEFPKVLCSGEVKIFKAMGAIPLKIAVALTDFVLPKFHKRLLKYEGDTKRTYLNLLQNLFIVSRFQGKAAAASRNVLNTKQCYVARDGSFHALGHLIVPDEDLTEKMFEDQPGLFADGDMILLMELFSKKSSIRSLETHPELILECAEKVLAETVSASVDPETTREKAVRLVKYIYENPEAGGVDWMDAKWKIVPRQTNLPSPYDIEAPDLPTYMAFSELVDFSNLDIIWTQRGFFPGDLMPSQVFKTRLPAITLHDILKHLNVLVKDIAPLWRLTEEQFKLKAILFKIYGTIERIVGSSDHDREWYTTHSGSYLKVPYILNGNDKNPSEKTSWVWPAQLMFDIDSNIPSYQVIDPVLRHYRKFLVAAGAEEMVHVIEEVQVEGGRERGFMEDRILKHFESQSQQTGFMDIRFKFEAGLDILAHKVVLASASRFYLDPIAGVWSSSAIMDPEELVADTIDLSEYGIIRDAFWGLLYYFYSDTLIQSNGAPVLECEKRAGSPIVVEESNSDNESEWEDRQKTPVKDKSALRVQYLMELQAIANRFEVSRLKDLIAQELIMGRKVIHSNVFSIRDHAEHNQADNVREYCDLFIEKNKESVIKYVEGEIRVLRDELEKFDRKESSDEYGGDDNYESSELSNDGDDGGDSDEESVDEFFECISMDDNCIDIEGGWGGGRDQRGERLGEKMHRNGCYDKRKLLQVSLYEKLQGAERNLIELLKEP